MKISLLCSYPVISEGLNLFLNDKYQNKIVTNRKSPANKQAYIDAYKASNSKATRGCGHFLTITFGSLL